MRTVAADQDGDDQRTAGKAQFHGLRNAGNPERNAAQHDAQRDADENRNQVGMVETLERIAEEPLGMGYRKFGTHDRHPVAQLQLQIPCSHQVDTRTVDACNGDAARGADAQFGECLAVQLGFGDKYSA